MRMYSRVSTPARNISFSSRRILWRLSTALRAVRSETSTKLMTINPPMSPAPSRNERCRQSFTKEPFGGEANTLEEVDSNLP